mgnify:CR=1 FL=1
MDDFALSLDSSEGAAGMSLSLKRLSSVEGAKSMWAPGEEEVQRRKSVDSTPSMQKANRRDAGMGQRPTVSPNAMITPRILSIYDDEEGEMKREYITPRAKDPDMSSASTVDWLSSIR